MHPGLGAYAAETRPLPSRGPPEAPAAGPSPPAAAPHPQVQILHRHRLLISPACRVRAAALEGSAASPVPTRHLSSRQRGLPGDGRGAGFRRRQHARVRGRASPAPPPPARRRSLPARSGEHLRRARAARPGVRVGRRAAGRVSAGGSGLRRPGGSARSGVGTWGAAAAGGRGEPRSEWTRDRDPGAGVEGVWRRGVPWGRGRGGGREGMEDLGAARGS